MTIKRRDFFKAGLLTAGGVATGLTTGGCGDVYKVEGDGPFLVVTFHGLCGFIFDHPVLSTPENPYLPDRARAVHVVLMNPAFTLDAEHVPRLMIADGSAPSKEKRLDLKNRIFKFEYHPRDADTKVVLMSPGCAPSSDGGWRPLNWVARIDRALHGQLVVRKDLTYGEAMGPTKKPVKPIAISMVTLNGGFLEGSHPHSRFSKEVIWAMKAKRADAEPAYEQAFTDLVRWVVPLDRANPDVTVVLTDLEGKPIDSKQIRPTKRDRPIRLDVIHDKDPLVKAHVTIEKNKSVDQFAAFYSIFHRKVGDSVEEIPYDERPVPVVSRSLDDPYDTGKPLNARGEGGRNVGEPMCNGGGTADPPEPPP